MTPTELNFRRKIQAAREAKMEQARRDNCQHSNRVPESRTLDSATGDFVEVEVCRECDKRITSSGNRQLTHSESGYLWRLEQAKQ